MRECVADAPAASSAENEEKADMPPRDLDGRIVIASAAVLALLVVGSPTNAENEESADVAPSDLDRDFEADDEPLADSANVPSSVALLPV